jgi:DNA-binding beta-propeller fold protein YncE
MTFTRLLPSSAAFLLALFANSAAVAASPALVLNSRDASISVIDLEKGTEIKRVPTGKEPHHLYPTPDGKTVIVANAAGNDLLFLDPRTAQPQGRLKNIDDPYHLALSPDNKLLTIASNRLNRVDVYSYATGTDGLPQIKLLKRYSLAKVPSHIAYSADSQWVFITLQESNEIAAIDLKNQVVAWKMSTGKQPAGIQISPDDQLLFVGVMGEDYVDVIDWWRQKSVKKLRTGLGAHAFRPLGDKLHLFVSNRAANTVSIVKCKPKASSPRFQCQVGQIAWRFRPMVKPCT